VTLWVMVIIQVGRLLFPADAAMASLAVGSMP
jgi:hypothetical protein